MCERITHVSYPDSSRGLYIDTNKLKQLKSIYSCVDVYTFEKKRLQLSLILIVLF